MSLRQRMRLNNRKRLLSWTRLAQSPKLPRRRSSRQAQHSRRRLKPGLSRAPGMLMLSKLQLSCQHRMIPISSRTHRPSQRRSLHLNQPRLRLPSDLKMSACPFLFQCNRALLSSVPKQQPQLVLKHRASEIMPSSWTQTGTDQQVTQTLPKWIRKRRLQMKPKQI